MATGLDIKTKTFFQIPPKKQGCSRLTKDIFDATTERVVFMDQAFDLDSIQRISEVYQVTELCYRFYVYLGYSEIIELSFNFKRKGDALMAQRELGRAWTRTGEFEYEDVQAGESAAVQ